MEFAVQVQQQPSKNVYIYIMFSVVALEKGSAEHDYKDKPAIFMFWLNSKNIKVLSPHPN